jgi:hypothetical protein
MRAPDREARSECSRGSSSLNRRATPPEASSPARFAGRSRRDWASPSSTSLTRA